VRLHVVDAFAPDNFFGVKENIFGRAREAALVGVPSHEIDYLDALVIRPCELLLRVDTADDLVLGLLNKPQYTEEILRPSAAAFDGEVAWLEEVTALRLTQERLENEVTLAKGAIAEERARTEKVTQSLAEAKRQLELCRTEIENKAALYKAAMRQAQFARDLADKASLAAAEAERERVEAVRAQAELQTRISERINEADQLRQQIESIHGSICWRLTWPIRWLHRQATRLKGALSKEQMLKLED